MKPISENFCSKVLQNAITQAVGFRYAWEEEINQFAHATGLMVISPTGVIAYLKSLTQ